MAKKKSVKRHPRLVCMGDVVRSKSDETPQVVRRVDVVVHLANGVSEVYSPGEEVEVLSGEELPSVEELMVVLEADEMSRSDLRRLGQALLEEADYG